MALACTALACWPAAVSAAPSAPEISTEDVARFYRVYEAAGGHPTAEQLERDYLQPGSPALHRFQALRNVTAERIAASIAAHPETYADARRCLAILPAVKARLTAALARLEALYPEAKRAPVTIVVGRGRPVGITEPSGVTMGLEALCAAEFMDPNPEDRFVHTVAHEYGHVQQSEAVQALDPGRPGATVLAMSLMEGVGEFTAELISGGVGDHQHAAWTKGREAEIEAAFLRDADKTDLSAWMYNGPGDAAHPGDLGYWVGYRIVKAYYVRAADKHAALKTIFEMRDPKAFLAASGWTPGMAPL
ncbi:MAG TPA: DUF2268 domain-containing putative Zn-dependent protease [Phenylobacterium sp.]|nr:DUF2268 domain-containing putative Zn-dependent protease [Phenylobacterium sp.]